MDLEDLIDAKLIAEMHRQRKLHTSERAVYLLQVALNDIAAWPCRWVPEDGYMCTYTVTVANQLDSARVVARIRQISPSQSMVA